MTSMCFKGFFLLTTNQLKPIWIQFGSILTTPNSDHEKIWNSGKTNRDGSSFFVLWFCQKCCVYIWLVGGFKDFLCSISNHIWDNHSLIDFHILLIYGNHHPIPYFVHFIWLGCHPSIDFHSIIFQDGHSQHQAVVEIEDPSYLRRPEIDLSIFSTIWSIYNILGIKCGLIVG